MDRENSQLSIEIGFTQIGSVNEFLCIIEQGLCINARLKRIKTNLNLWAEAGNVNGLAHYAQRRARASGSERGSD